MIVTCSKKKYAMANKKMTRDTTNGIIGGVCAGLARYLGWSPTSFRLFYVFLSIISAGFPGTLVYILLWIFMPREDSV